MQAGKERGGHFLPAHGNVVGVHEVYVCTPTQTITLRHEVHTRAMLAEGGVEAARFMVGKPAGMYNMKDLLKG